MRKKTVENILVHKEMTYYDICDFGLQYRLPYWKKMKEGILFTNNKNVLNIMRITRD